jgi:hypothetical protein
MELVTVGEFPTDFQAELARSLLEANGIRACIAGGMPVYSADAVGFQGGLVQVAKADEDRALRILRKATHQEKEVPAGPTWQDRFGRIVGWLFVFVLPILLVFGILASALRWW